MAQARMLAVSGSRNISQAQAWHVENILSSYKEEFRNIIHGACHGVDTVAAIWGHHNYKPATALVPANKSRVNAMSLFYSCETVYMPEDTDYAGRNRELIRRADMLLAFPQCQEEDPRSQRSGTWQTIRYAQTKGIFTLVYVLDLVGMY